MQASTLPDLRHKKLVDEKLWKRLVGRVMKDEGKTREKAESIMDEALCFLKLCADFPKERFAPSRGVDIGWHAFLMYTREYAEFCQRVAGRFIHHAPSDDDKPVKVTVQATVSFMQRRGLIFNEEL
ncbi:MAG: hypothetical protein A3C80_01360 [Candidatus Ryanbacteria bacterium RIFCSPHIGHO2_02_FULL_45_43]|uniref:Uncharacterized protein n=1 Tax=Candidatus Ryanbacteria bacterium RIFCSPHIGHO2_01_45_13 TaxID=1802112 RepID=A0A1G2G265_9BACT|nr:MAG: hypothetical protein A2718_04185 [Candidatus Ryanbacteria bacterium RIFCSPHIGHO2_01_FULL_44_130]OGZ44092.1 MAG: hypothetical protein A2W41_00065 [Candidatus Ryanbacteria bacterium RIFCSPHIGHO2_01_45_13]OGZ48903.1 MAG: hypothetical protein A3C80_01360 [Candidatus Ryanbacteria bacterium RIFCSPHIGHO2_02_FULL_45_43]OGZ50948.1 MAG: hypothetical protein A3E55_02895 [Candidatus Ryanbacteria bacterium RIFCSPHIGHO2_12_FULL_44_20]OGZ51774.1 MAG: hypothetical protein A3A17_02220 [Candidatus Ryanba